MTRKSIAGGYTISIEVTALKALYTGDLMAEIDRLKERNVTRQLARDIERIGDDWLRQKHKEGMIFEPMVSVHAQPAHIILIIGERSLVEEREAALAQTDISLPEPMARVVLELYAAAYSEGQAPEEATPLLNWIREHHPRLLEDREFSHLPVPAQIINRNEEDPSPMKIDQYTIDTLRTLAHQCSDDDYTSAGVDPATLLALLDRSEKLEQLEREAPAPDANVRPGLEMAIAHCHALQQQGLTHSRSDVIANDFKNFLPGLEWAAARCKALHSQGFDYSRHDVLIQSFEVRIANEAGKTEDPA